MNTIDSLYIDILGEITLYEKVKLPAKKIIHYIFPIYSLKEIKVKVGKINIKDQLAARKMIESGRLITSSNDTRENLKFFIWLLDRIIKKANPYWDKSKSELFDMCGDQTFKEISELYFNSLPESKKKIIPVDKK